MVRVVMGLKGEGKTKKMIEWVNASVDHDPGVVVLIERGHKLTFDIHHGARLVDSSQYGVSGFDMLRGLIAGLCACNYDITQIFIDSVFKITDVHDIPALDAFLDWLSEFGAKHHVNFTLTVSEDAARATDNIKKYFEAR